VENVACLLPGWAKDLSAPLYMLISGYVDEEVEDVYEQLDEVMYTVKKNVSLIILVDWNATFGEGQQIHAVGKYGLGVRNNRGEP